MNSSGGPRTPSWNPSPPATRYLPSGHLKGWSLTSPRTAGTEPSSKDPLCLAGEGAGSSERGPEGGRAGARRWGVPGHQARGARGGAGTPARARPPGPGTGPQSSGRGVCVCEYMCVSCVHVWCVHEYVCVVRACVCGTCVCVCVLCVHVCAVCMCEHMCVVSVSVVRVCPYVSVVCVCP